MWTIRYAPVPWSVKQAGMDLITPRTVVVGTALIPDAEGRILLLHACYSGRWILPGGAVHPGEDPRRGVERECREELGCEVEVQRLVGLCAVAKTPLLFVDFLCAPLAGLPRLSHEHDAWRYVPVAALPWRIRMAVEDAARNDPAPVIRTVHNRR
jgi:ADP-ribose pyrophosphatase YjhB (NUDIX family)